MKAATLLIIIAESITLMKSVGVIDSNDNFVIPNAAQDQQLAAGVETILKNHGVNVPDKVDKIITLIPMILEIV